MDLAEGDSFEQGIKLAVRPSWSRRTSSSASNAMPSRTIRTPCILLADYELASRLSYFLWSSMPDDELFRLAGTRTSSATRTCWKSRSGGCSGTRSRARSVENFAGQWLKLRKLDDDDARPPTRFPTSTPTCDPSMMRETELFFD